MHFITFLNLKIIVATSFVTGFFSNRTRKPDVVVVKMALVREFVFVTCGRPFVMV